MNVILVTLAVLASLMLGTAAGWPYDQRPDPDKIRERIETLTMWKMMNTLDLDRDTSEKILEIRGRYLKRRKDLSYSLSRDFDRLRKLLRDTPAQQGEQELAELLESIRKKRKELTRLMDEQYDAVAKLLPVRKQAQLVLFLKEFHREIQSIIRQAEGPPGPPPHPGPGRPPHLSPGDRPPGGPPGGPPLTPPPGGPPLGDYDEE